MAPGEMHTAPILTGQTSGLAPVVFLTGGPQAVGSPYPALNLEVELPPRARGASPGARLLDRRGGFICAGTPDGGAPLGGRDCPHRDAQHCPGGSVHRRSRLGRGLRSVQKLPTRCSWGLRAAPCPSIVCRASRIRDIHCARWQRLHPPVERTAAAGDLLPGAPAAAGGADMLQGLVRNYLASREEDGAWTGNPAWQGSAAACLPRPSWLRLRGVSTRPARTASSLQTSSRPAGFFAHLV